MINLADYALNNRALVKFFIAVLVIGGIFAFNSMSKLEDPEIKVKQAMVLTVYPGASAHQVELEVTDVLEKSIRSMGAISSIESKSMADMSLITVELESTVSPDELEQKWDILRRKVTNAQAQMPDGVRPSVVMDDFGDVYGMFYAITTDGVDDEQLLDYAQLVKRELQDIEGVRRVEIYGNRTPCINIEMMQDKMANLGVHPMEVLSTLNSQNKTVYPGYFNSGDQRLRVAINDSYKSIEDIKNLIIQGHEDDQLRLRDIASITEGYEDPAVLRELTEKAEQIMRDEPAITLVTNDWEPMTPTLMVNYYQPIARSVGLSRSDVGLSMLAATDGMPVGSFYEGVHAKPLYMKSVNSEGEKVEALDNIPVWSVLPSTAALNEESLKGLLMGTMSGEDLLAQSIGSIPLNQATQGISLKWEDPVVRRYNGQRAMRAQCNNVLGYTAESARALIAEKVDTLTLPEGYAKQWLGEHKASGESMKYLFGNIPLAVILMIAILIMLFKDFRKPIIIFCCLPLAAIGIVLGMLISGKEFGFVAIVGALGLVGMMIKNGVVLLDEIGLQIASGKSQTQALLDSSSSRFRPVMMASLTTILGMIPLLGDDMFGSMAVTIMGGLLVGTVITLVFIPVLYAIFFKERKN